MFDGFTIAVATKLNTNDPNEKDPAAIPVIRPLLSGKRLNAIANVAGY